MSAAGAESRTVAKPAAILLDALGTLVELEPPAPHLRRELHERFDVQITHDDAQRAIAAEIVYYRAHLHEGRDEARIAALRVRCAEVLRSALHAYPELQTQDLTDALLSSLHFNAYPDVEPALRAARTTSRKLIVVSNWDASLHDVLARLGLTVHLDGVVTSAETGKPKPDPTIFHRALAIARTDPENAIHVGDSVAEDVVGARAAGITPVLIQRRSAPRPAGVATISSLSELPLT